MCSPTGSVLWASYRLTPQQIDWTIGDEATALPDGLVRPPAWSKSVEEQMKILGEQMKEEPKVERGEPTSGLGPLTCSLRVNRSYRTILCFTLLDNRRYQRERRCVMRCNKLSSHRRSSRRRS